MGTDFAQVSFVFIKNIARGLDVPIFLLDWRCNNVVYVYKFQNNTRAIAKRATAVPRDRGGRS